MKEFTLTALLVGIGGFAGSVTRFVISAAARQVWPQFPLGTMLVNLTGCFLMGMLMQWAAVHGQISEQHKLILASGFLGGFTTMSAFYFDSANLIHRGHTGISVAYFCVTVIFCAVAYIAGVATIRPAA